MELKPRYLIIAALLHAALFGLLVVSAYFQPQMEPPEVITAILVSPPPPKPEEKPEPEKPKPEKPAPKSEPEAEPPPEKIAADVLRSLNCETIGDLKRDAGVRVGAVKDIMLARIAEMEIKCRLEIEDKLKKEAEKKKLEEEEKQKKEDERLKKEDEKRNKDMMEQMLDQERRERELAEQQARKAALEAAAVSEANARAEGIANQALSEWIVLVEGKVRRNWQRLPNLSSELVCTVQISQLPSGEIIDVKIARSSGNKAYDDSVERAMRKSSPLPRLNDPLAFSMARNINLKFEAAKLAKGQ